MTTNPPRPRPTRPVHPLIAAGFALLLAGLVAWLWLGDYRYAVTGAAALLALAVAAGVSHRAGQDGRA